MIIESKKKNNKISLEELALRDYFILFDTSVLCNFLNEIRTPKTLSQKFAIAEKHCSFLNLIKGYIEMGKRFYVTSFVLEELNRAYNYPIKKRINRLSRRTKSKEHPEVLKLIRKRKQEHIERRKLIETFKDKNRVLSFEKEIFYNPLFSKYDYISSRYKLTDTDFDFLISGVSIAKSGDYVNLISNDFKILKALSYILRKEETNSEKIKFFIRTDFSDFEQKIINF